MISERKVFDDKDVQYLLTWCSHGLGFEVHQEVIGKLVLAEARCEELRRSGKTVTVHAGFDLREVFLSTRLQCERREADERSE